MPFVDLSSQNQGGGTQNTQPDQSQPSEPQGNQSQALPSLSQQPVQQLDQQQVQQPAQSLNQKAVQQPAQASNQNPAQKPVQPQIDQQTINQAGIPQIQESQKPQEVQHPKEVQQTKEAQQVKSDSAKSVQSMPSPIANSQSEPTSKQNNENLPTPPSELNSLDIPVNATKSDGLDQEAKEGKNKVEMTVSEDGVKTITGPQPDKPIQEQSQQVSSQPQSKPQSQINSTNQTNQPTQVQAQINQNLLPADTSIEDIMKLAEEKEASDIHFKANYSVHIRKDGDLSPVTQPITPEIASNLAMEVLRTDKQKQTYEKEKEIDFSYTNQNDTRFRVNLFTERGNSAGALRLIAKKIRTIEELDLPQILYQLIEEPHGLILVVGPTGSGKSTTLAAMLNHINMNKTEHIVTIEDPVEYIYPIAKSIVDQREVGSDTLSWKKALKSVLREDPNVVLVGEMRDLDTIESTITIAETGHLTFATLHTNSAAQSIDRIIDVFPEGAKDQIRAQLANVLTAVISQRLIPLKNGGRKAAMEIMLGTGAVRNAVREGKTHQLDNIIQTSGDLGMMTLEKSLVEMVKKGEINKEQAKAASVKPDEIESLLSKG